MYAPDASRMIVMTSVSYLQNKGAKRIGVEIKVDFLMLLRGIVQTVKRI